MKRYSSAGESIYLKKDLGKVENEMMSLHSLQHTNNSLSREKLHITISWNISTWSESQALTGNNAD